ncbi:hypothetical protein PL321_12250 [Caloramator sp. mosi_1]|uniref:hypothetical protein n=1 Tax=Caloramator sp. mosi_1 TaxID=3023090 RepID=UPI00235F69C1|nr:hypothetical protein [Caloramator sp. mosi_1]WDC83482.1 hypothetical protein PL321_12250 [Caloramator sp. mosi_1]
MEQARKYLNFKEVLPTNYIPIYISVSPPSNNPCLTVVYLINNKRIILSEWVGNLEFNPNAKMGNINVLIVENSSVIFIKWVKDNLVYEICGEKQSLNDIIRIAEEITKAKFILQGE